MSRSDDCQNDFVHNLLQFHDGEPAPGETLREAVLVQTVRVIRFRRRLKKSLLAVSLVVCYFAGVATMGFRSKMHVSVPVISTGQVSVNPSSQPHEKPPARAIADQKPKQQPATPPMSRQEMLRREADQFLADGDMKQAIRKYELALDLAPADQRALSPQHDTWLLMALKNARPKEIIHERSQP
jgi:hypothetical protein